MNKYFSDNVTTSLIGKKCYPIDNSYSINILTRKEARLAGTAWSDPVLVTIISEPYELETHFIGKTDKNTFVTVLYNNEIYIVLNNFTDDFYSRNEY